jgi:hypothetical protein
MHFCICIVKENDQNMSENFIAKKKKKGKYANNAVVLCWYKWTRHMNRI